MSRLFVFNRDRRNIGSLIIQDTEYPLVQFLTLLLCGAIKGYLVSRDTLKSMRADLNLPQTSNKGRKFLTFIKLGPTSLRLIIWQISRYNRTGGRGVCVHVAVRDVHTVSYAYEGHS